MHLSQVGLLVAHTALSKLMRSAALRRHPSSATWEWLLLPNHHHRLPRHTMFRCKGSCTTSSTVSHFPNPTMLNSIRSPYPL